MLELRNVSAGYAGQNVIQGISLRLEPGKIYTIVGRNGSGKSTLLKTCAGLLPPDSGNILLDGKKLHQYLPIERARKISYLSQTRSTTALSVERMVEHGRYPRLASPRSLNDEDRRIIQAAMESMQVDYLRKERLSEISGGERQRVYISMQLAQDAPTLLLDEPTTYMDIEHQLTLMELLMGLSRKGKCIVMVLHDLALALNSSDTIIAMEEGRIIGCTAPEVMLADGKLERIFHVRIHAVENSGKGYLLSIRKDVS